VNEIKSLKVVLLAFHSSLKTIHNLIISRTAAAAVKNSCSTHSWSIEQYNMLTPAILFVVIVGGVAADPLAGTPIKFVLSAKFVIQITYLHSFQEFHEIE
jgi:hypothetical protein